MAGPEVGVLDPVERRQLGRLRLWGTAGALLMMFGSTSSYGAATPIPNPVDGLRLIGLLSRVGPASLAISYSGIGLVVMCWFMIGRFTAPGRPRRLSRTQLTHTLAMWAVPFLVTPPIFSRDVYSYLAVGAMMVHGDNPYQSGPYDTLGDSNPFAHQVDARWQHTSTPYGPAFLLIAKAVVLVSGNHVIIGVLLQRFVELIGIALIVWALPRLARRCGIDPVSALWLGALNPLLLFHLIAGGHNEALMIGLMLAGLEIALSLPTLRRSIGPPGSDLWRMVAGTALITIAIGIKVTAAMALAFLAIALARRAGGRWRDLVWVSGLLAAVAIVTFGLLTVTGRRGPRLDPCPVGARQRAVLPFDLDDPGRRRRLDRPAPGSRGSHRQHHRLHAAGRYGRRRGTGRLRDVAVLAASAGADPGPRHRARSVRTAQSGDPAVVPAVGGAPAGCVDELLRLPQSHGLVDRRFRGDHHAERRPRSRVSPSCRR